MYEGASLLMIASMKAVDVADVTVKRALADVEDMTSFHKILMFKDLDKVARHLATIDGVLYDSIQREFINAVMHGTMEGLRKRGYRDVEGYRAMDGGVPLGYAVEFNEPFSYIV